MCRSPQLDAEVFSVPKLLVPNIDCPSPDSSFLSWSGRTDRQRAEFFREIRTKSRQRTKTRQIESDRKTSESLFYKNPDRIETDRIRKANRHRTRFSGKSGQKRVTNRTRIVLSADVCLNLIKPSSQLISFPLDKIIQIAP